MMSGFNVDGEALKLHRISWLVVGRANSPSMLETLPYISLQLHITTLS
jgi:hypothetical protein